MLAANAQAQAGQAGQARSAGISHVGFITFSPDGELSQPNRGLGINHIFPSFPVWAMFRLVQRAFFIMRYTRPARASWLLPIFKPESNFINLQIALPRWRPRPRRYYSSYPPILLLSFKS